MAQLIDRPALTRNRARAARQGAALFLHERVRDDVEDRLESVNRSFTSPAVVTGWPDIWDGWRGARVVPDDPVLDLAAQSHDLVISALALHWAEDPVGQLVQCRRALRPDGMMIAALFGGETLNELRAALTSAEAAETGGLSPRILPMGEIRDWGGLLNRAGLALPVADSALTRVHYSSPRALMRDLRAMGEGNALNARLRRPTRAGVIRSAEAIYTAQHAGADGRIPASFEIVTLTGWAPDDSQPQPLKPGSATHRLDEILAGLKEGG